MNDQATLEHIAQIIQLAITPVFMIVGIAGLLNVLTGRHGRMVDRARALQKGLAKVTDEIASEMTDGTVADDAAKNATAGIGKLAKYLPLLGLVVAAAIIISVVVGSFGSQR